MKLKKLTAAFLAVLLCICTLSVNAFADNEKKGITLNKSSITMVLGGTYTLKPTLKGLETSSIKWSTSDKSVATVAKGGVVTAQKAGTAKITVKVKDTDYSAVCTVKVRLPKNTNELVKGMGSGWTLYNSLDVYGADHIQDIEDYETAWGNPKVTEKLVGTVKKAGFNTFRISARCENHMGSDGTISEEWLDRVQEVVDYAYDKNMYVILNTNESWISVKNEKNVRKKYAAMWGQIAERFKDYDERLIFEGAGTTNFCIDEGESEVFPISGRKSLNNLYADFVKTVRGAGKYNEKRFLIVTPADSYAALEVPDDERVLVGVVNLAASTMTGKFNEQVQQEIDDEFNNIKSSFTDKGYNVIIVQWGIEDKSDTAERVKAAKYYVKTAKENDIPCIWAEWIDELLNRQKLKWSPQKLVDAVTDY